MGSRVRGAALATQRPDRGAQRDCRSSRPGDPRGGRGDASFAGFLGTKPLECVPEEGLWACTSHTAVGGEEGLLPEPVNPSQRFQVVGWGHRERKSPAQVRVLQARVGSIRERPLLLQVCA